MRMLRIRNVYRVRRECFVCGVIYWLGEVAYLACLMGDLCEDGVAGGESGLRTALRAHAEILRERASWFEDLATTWYDWREGEGEPVNHAWADGSQSRRDIR